eukprot:5156137-Pleurochrysis_carterae.AAC.3
MPSHCSSCCLHPSTPPLMSERENRAASRDGTGQSCSPSDGGGGIAPSAKADTCSRDEGSPKMADATQLPVIGGKSAHGGLRVPPAGTAWYGVSTAARLGSDRTGLRTFACA